MLDNVRIRRARALELAWQRETFVLTNYQTQVRITAAEETFKILGLLGDWTRLSDLYLALAEYSPKSIRTAIRQLIEKSFVVEEGTPEAKRDARLAEVWWAWMPAASFHFGTKGGKYASPAVLERVYRQYLATSRQPSRAKKYPGAQTVQLSKEPPPTSEFAQVLLARRTHREYAGKSLPLSSISKLLYYTWRVTGEVDAPPFGRLFLKTSPSAGARHPGEVYVLAMRVTGLAQGLYHYDCVHHRLERLRAVPVIKRAMEYASDQEFLRDASALFVMTAVFPRTLWKYRFPRAYRVVLLDAGHLCQTFCLVATWMGLAPFCTAALQDGLIEKDLELDGIKESAIYLAGVGVPFEPSSRSKR